MTVALMSLVTIRGRMLYGVNDIAVNTLNFQQFGIQEKRKLIKKWLNDSFSN